MKCSIRGYQMVRLEGRDFVMEGCDIKCIKPSVREEEERG